MSSHPLLREVEEAENKHHSILLDLGSPPPAGEGRFTFVDDPSSMPICSGPYSASPLVKWVARLLKETR